MSADNREKPYRIAFRREGSFVNAYFARTDTMEDAKLIASVSSAMLDEDTTLWEEYQQMMRGAFDRINVKLGIGTGSWISQIAPEHERTGEA